MWLGMVCFERVGLKLQALGKQIVLTLMSPSGSPQADQKVLEVLVNMGVSRWEDLSNLETSCWVT